LVRPGEIIYVVRTLSLLILEESNFGSCGLGVSDS
jgi:hypothetical protein